VIESEEEPIVSDKIPLPEETTEATETGMDQRKPKPLPHQAVQERSNGATDPSRQSTDTDEHPMSVGKP